MHPRLRGLTFCFVLFAASVGACATATDLGDGDDDDEELGDGSVRTPTKDAGRDARASSSSSSGKTGSSSSGEPGASSSSSSGEPSSSSSGGSSSSSSGSSSSSSSGGSSSSSSGSGSSSGSPACTPVLVINEVQQGGAGGGSDEFVEILNKSTCDLNFSQFKLTYQSSNGAEASRFTGNVSIVQGGYLVIGGASFTGTKQGSLSSGISNNGQLGIRRNDASNALLDSVAWGSVSGGTFAEGAAVASPADGKSIARTPNGVDTNHNDVDFVLANTPTPGAAND